MIQDPVAFALITALAAIYILVVIGAIAAIHGLWHPVSPGDRVRLRIVRTTEMTRGTVILSLPYLFIVRYQGATHFHWPRTVEIGEEFANGAVHYPSDLQLIRHGDWIEMAVREPEQAHLAK
jgi:hypothetical protein